MAADAPNVDAPANLRDFDKLWQSAFECVAGKSKLDIPVSVNEGSASAPKWRTTELGYGAGPHITQHTFGSVRHQGGASAVSQPRTGTGKKELEALASNPYPEGHDDHAGYAASVAKSLSRWDAANQAEKRELLETAYRVHYQATSTASMAHLNKPAARQASPLPAKPTPVVERPEDAPSFDVEAGHQQLMAFAANPYPQTHAEHADYATIMGRLIARWDASDTKGKQSVLDTARNANSYAKRVMS